MNKGKPALVAPALLVAVAAISFAAIFFIKAEPTHPLVSAGVRLAVAALLLAPFSVRALVNGGLRGRALISSLFAGLAYAVHFGAWVTSLGLTSVAASVTLVTINPLILALVGTLTRRDKPGGRLWLSIGLACVGVAIIGGHDLVGGRDALLGDGLALVGALAMSCYLLLGRSLGDKLDPLAYSGVATAVGAALLLGCATVAGVPIRVASSEALFYLVLAAVVPQLIGHNLITWSLRHAAPAAVAMSIVGEPAGAAILGWLWLGRPVSGITALGCIVTLSAVIIAVRQGTPGKIRSK
ncbi:MAG: DMT family transporter [Candidatus Alcyoniella australis]|nr:DMT family transporter [Candidatus Alcyoniella australis]